MTKVEAQEGQKPAASNKQMTAQGNGNMSITSNIWDNKIPDWQQHSNQMCLFLPKPQHSK